MVTAAGAFKAGNLDEALAHATDAVSLTSVIQQQGPSEREGFD
jgi:hypothetical protein